MIKVETAAAGVGRDPDSSVDAERIKWLHRHSSSAYDALTFAAEQPAADLNMTRAIKSFAHTLAALTCDAFSRKNGVILALDNALQAEDDHGHALAKQSLEMIAIIAERGRGSAQELNSEAACKRVDKLLGNYISNKLVSSYALMALCSMSSYPENVVRFSSFGTFFRVVRVAQMHHTDAVIAEWALRTFRCFLTFKSNQAKLVAAGVCEVVAQLLDEHCENNNASLTECALRIICSFCGREVQDRFSASGICETLSQKVLAGQNLRAAVPMRLAVWVLRAIGALSQNNDKTKQIFAEFNIFQKLRHLVTIFGVENAVFAGAYMHCVGSLGYPNQANQAALTQEGVLEVTMCMIHKHIDDTDVAEDAMRCVRAIGKSCHHNLDLLFASDACAIVMKCIQNQLEMPRKARNILVLQWGWCAVAALSEHSGCVSKFWPALGLASWQLADCETDADIAQFALNALASLCRSEEISRSISTEDIAVLSEVFIHHNKCELCVEEWLYAVGSLCTVPASKNRQICSANNIASQIVSAMNLYKDKSAVSERACWCLCQMLQEAERPSGSSLVSTVLESGVGLVLSSILMKHASNGIVAEWGTKVIVLLSSTGQSNNLSKLYASKTLEAAVFVLNQCTINAYKVLNAGIASWALKAIRRLSTDINIDQLISSNARITCLNQLKLVHYCAPESLIRLTFISLTGILSREKTMKIEDTKRCSSVLVNALKFFTDSDMLVLTGCAFAKAIMQCNGKHAEALGAAELPKVLVATLVCHKNSSSVTAIICSTLHALCVQQDPRNISRFMRAGACSPLLSILSDHLQAATSVSNVPLAIALSSAIATLLDSSGPDQRRHQIAFGDLRAPLTVCRCLRVYMEHPAVAKSCCKALALLAQENALIQDLVHECNGISLAVCALERHINDANCAFCAINAVVALCLHNTINAGAAGETACRLVVNAIRLHHKCEAVHEASCRAIVALNPLNNIWGTFNAGEAVLSALSAHPDSELVTQRVCQAIGSLAELQSNKKLLGECGACQKLVLALSLYMDKMDFWTLIQLKRAASEQMALHGADAMFYLACGSGDVEAKHRQFLLSAGAMQILAKAMNLYSDNSSVTEACLRAAVVIADGTKTHTARLMGKLASSAVDALHTFPANKRVSKWGIRLVACLSIFHITRLAEAGACEAAPMIILAHLHSASIIGAGCDALCGLAMSSTHAIRLGQTGSCEAVVAVLNTHSSNVDVAERACRAMSNLARVKGNSNWFGPAGACSALVATYRANPTAETLVQSAWSAVSQICSSQENCHRMYLAGVCEPLVHSLRALAHSPDVARAASFAISKLSKDGLSSNTQALLNAGVCENLVATLKLHQTDQSCAFSLIRCMSVLANGPDREQERTRLGKAGGCELVILVMNTFFADGAIARTGCLAIRGLAMTHHVNQLAFLSAGGCETVCRSLVTFKASPAGALISEAALWAMANLCAGNAKVIACLGHEHSACAGIIEALLRHYKTSPEVILWSAKALGHLLRDKENAVYTGLHGGAEVLATVFLFVNDVQGSLIDSLIEAMVALIHDRVGAARLGSIRRAVQQIVNILRYQCCNNMGSGSQERDVVFSMHIRTLTLIRGLAANSRSIQRNLGSYGAVNAVLSSLHLAVSELRRFSLEEKNKKVRATDSSHQITEAALNAVAALCLSCDENRALASTASEQETLVYLSSCAYVPLNIQQLARHTLEILHTSNE